MEPAGLETMVPLCVLENRPMGEGLRTRTSSEAIQTDGTRRSTSTHMPMPTLHCH